MSKGDPWILCYTRQPLEDILYAPRLAYSMHLAYSEDGEHFSALNHNSGVLFAKATENADRTMNPKSLKKPYLFRLSDGSYGIVAVRVEADGEPDAESRGAVLLFTTKDFLQYREVGLLLLTADQFVETVQCCYLEDQKRYRVLWQDAQGWHSKETEDLYGLNMAVPSTAASAPAEEHVAPFNTGIEGIVPGNAMPVSAEVAETVRLRLSTPENIRILVPEKVTASDEAALANTKVTAFYSDGTTAQKKVDWDTSAVDWSTSGEYQVSGTVHQDHFPFPFATNRADPCIRAWNGNYYFIATNDADSNHTLYIRKARSIPELAHAEETLLLDSDTYASVKGLLWAPEFHVIQGELYIFFACTTGEFFWEESHVMKLRQGGEPACREDWSMPEKVVRKDGSPLCEAGKVISLDMTVIEGREYYVAWSERQFKPVDIGAWVYLAKIDPREPWKLISDPILLTKPEYGWENNHTFVDEGPFALQTDRHLFLTFSAAAVDATYTVGLLSAEPDADLSNPSSWTKGNYPILTSRSVPGEFGPGHNAYVTDEDGDIWNTYHARPGVKGSRSSGIRRVHFDVAGYPILDLTEEKDLQPSLRQVSMVVEVL